MKIKDVKVAEPFKSLFRIRKEVYKEVLQSIKEDGYDKSEPLLIGKYKKKIFEWICECEEECEECENLVQKLKEEISMEVLIDGHTRLKIAEKLELEEISVIVLEFDSEEEAVRKAIERNSLRRLVTMGDKFKCVRLVDEIGKQGSEEGEARKLGKDFSNIKALIFENNDSKEAKASAKRTAKIVHVSDVQVHKIRTILKYADKEDIEKIENDEVGIDPIWKKAREIKEKIEEEIKNASKFNRTYDEEKDDNRIEWAYWSWNPVTGCKHGCEYCYARDIADRFYKEKFEPTFHENRILAPSVNKVPEEDTIGEHNVFVCSMADLFGDWVPDEWIQKVFEAIESGPKWWNYIFLTKNPKRYLKLEFPKRCWIGATADIQKRATAAFVVFDKMKKNGVKNKLFLSCEPLSEGIVLGKKAPIDWLIIGGCSRSTKVRAFQPEWKWVADLFVEAYNQKISCYWKPNLTIVPKEYPELLK